MGNLLTDNMEHVIKMSLKGCIYIRGRELKSIDAAEQVSDKDFIQGSGIHYGTETIGLEPVIASAPKTLKENPLQYKPSTRPI